MKMVRIGAKSGYFVVTWNAGNGNEMSKTVSTRGEVFSLVRSFQTIGITEYAVQRAFAFPVKVEESNGSA